MREAAAALGLGPGSPGSNDPRAIAALFRRVRADPALRRICTLAGRFRRVAQSRQRRKATHGYDDVVGVTLDGEIAPAPARRDGQAGRRGLELDTLRRLVERQALCRLHQGVEPVGKGPILVTVDESGSMQGRKVETAKALALALAWVARQQRPLVRPGGLLGDSGERLLALPPGRWDEDALADGSSSSSAAGRASTCPSGRCPTTTGAWAARRASRTSCSSPTRSAGFPRDLRDDFNAWKVRVKARVISLVIQSSPVT